MNKNHRPLVGDFERQLAINAQQQAAAAALAQFRATLASQIAAPMLAIEYEKARDEAEDKKNFQVNTGAPLSIAVQFADQVLMASGLLRPRDPGQVD